VWGFAPHKKSMNLIDLKEGIQKSKPIEKELHNTKYKFPIWLRKLSISKVRISYILLVLLALFMIFMLGVNPETIGSNKSGTNLYHKPASTAQAQELQADYELLWSYEADNWVGGVSVSSNGSYIAVGGGEEVSLLNREGELLWIHQIDGDNVWEISITSDGSYIVVGTDDGRINLFNRQGKILWKKDYHKDSYTGVSISPDGLYILVTVEENNEISLYNIEGKLLWSHKVGPNYPYDVSISSDGSCIVKGKYFNQKGSWQDSFYSLYNIEGKLLWSHKVDDYIYDVSISSDGSYIVLGTQSRVSLFNKQGKLLWSYYTDVGDNVKAVSISSDGLYIAKGTINGKLSLHDKWGELLWSYQIGGNGEDKNTNEVSLSSDGSYLVVGTNSGKIHFFAPTVDAIGDIKLILDQARSVISQEKTTGFNVNKAEALYSKANQDFSIGYYIRASKLANQTKNLALDIDQDGMLNKDDFAPTIKNIYIYYILTSLFLSLIFTIAYISNKRMITRKINECRLIIKQLESEGCNVSEFRDKLIKMKHLNQIEQEFKELGYKIQKLKQIESEISSLDLECIVKLYFSDS